MVKANHSIAFDDLLLNLALLDEDPDTRADLSVNILPALRQFARTGVRPEFGIGAYLQIQKLTGSAHWLFEGSPLWDEVLVSRLLQFCYDDRFFISLDELRAMRAADEDRMFALTESGAVAFLNLLQKNHPELLDSVCDAIMEERPFDLHSKSHADYLARRFPRRGRVYLMPDSPLWKSPIRETLKRHIVDVREVNSLRGPFYEFYLDPEAAAEQRQFVAERSEALREENIHASTARYYYQQRPRFAVAHV